MCGITGSYTRIFYIPYLLRRWSGQLSLVLYGTDDEEAKIIDYLDKREYSERLSLIVYLVKNGTEESKTFPINALRNLGIQNSRTTHYMVTDFDVWPVCTASTPCSHASRQSVQRIQEGSDLDPPTRRRSDHSPSRLLRSRPVPHVLPRTQQLHPSARASLALSRVERWSTSRRTRCSCEPASKRAFALMKSSGR